MQFALQPPAFVSRLFARAEAPPRVTRWYAAGVRQGTTREIPRMGPRQTVHCRDGEAWITHDGDPRDIVLQPQQSYRVEGHGRRMTVHALRGDCVLEIEVGD
ncbi:hypothetical protein GCM10028796_27700 [Ramlibacter monticola]|uniref:DUF2917 domain-containing protein n=1 Tax=Ramlibacter monticola TaxID=1926872 RepID=A0A936Z3R2_9BURK|nr:DUF2917 domain-containing protein [Ramlibacter monticola]MBL0393822.1 DUF2917 domain-containing protein [Ramlibacter monticola]